MRWTWETAWGETNDAFGQLASEIQACNGNLWWECGHQESERFPFSAYVSFSRDGLPGEEDIVISLSFKRSDGEIVFPRGIARGDGEILSDGPTGVISLAVDVASIRAWMPDRVSNGVGFIRDSRGLLRRELC